jgi:hypothetical protein
MRSKTPAVQERRPGRQSNPRETDELDRGLRDAVDRSSKAVSEKIDRLLREKYSSTTEKNA